MDCEPFDEMGLVEKAAYKRGTIALAQIICELLRAAAPKEVIIDLVEKIALYSTIEDGDSLNHLMEESCRHHRFFDLIDEPDWIADEGSIDGVPVLPGYSVVARDGNSRRIKVWCSYCFVWHKHGGGPKLGDGDGHRCAHCHNRDSPYDKTGYIVREVGEFPKEHRS